MKLKASKTDVWAANIEDRPGGLAAKLETLCAAGANLEFVIARRSPDKPGQGVVFLTPLKGARQVKAAQAAGFTPRKASTVRIEGDDKPGIGAKITSDLAAAGVNLRGLSAAAIGKKFVAHVALDSADDAAKAIRVLKALK
ncbi:MAG: ACT domain-containing protein [Planctomycetes bacterium]|nr:ACT domain-containing protein [Planctomycetota bacterium]